MPINYIALFRRLLGKTAEYIIWDDLTQIETFKVFNSPRLMKKYAKKHGYFVRDTYSRPKFFYKGIEVKPEIIPMTVIVE